MGKKWALSLGGKKIQWMSVIQTNILWIHIKQGVKNGTVDPNTTIIRSRSWMPVPSETGRLRNSNAAAFSSEARPAKYWDYVSPENIVGQKIMGGFARLKKILQIFVMVDQTPPQGKQTCKMLKKQFKWTELKKIVELRLWIAALGVHTSMHRNFCRRFTDRNEY